MRKAFLNKFISIYALRHSITKEIRYIGATIKSIEQRRNDHCKFAKNENNLYVHHWINSLKMKPEVICLEIVSPDKSWQDSERKWIAYYRKKGARLTNLTDGGEGALGCKPSKKSIAISRKRFLGNTFRKGIKLKKSTKQKLRQLQLGHKMHSNTRKAIRLANLGNQYAKGHKHSKEAKRKMSQALLGNTRKHDFTVRNK